MKKEYKINNIFYKKEPTLNELISTFITSYLDNELNIKENNINV